MKRIVVFATSDDRDEDLPVALKALFGCESRFELEPIYKNRAGLAQVHQ